MAAILLLAVLLGACTRTPPILTIGPEGGTVTGPMGASVVIPPGALTNPTPIAIALSGTDAPGFPATVAGAGPVFAFTPHGTVFATPVQVTLPFDPSAVPPGSTPILAKTNAHGDWVAADDPQVDGDTITAEIQGFSHLSAVAPVTEPNEDGLYRSWQFWAYPSTREFAELVGGNADPPPGDQYDDHLFGDLRFPRGMHTLAYGYVFSSADGATFWAGTEAPAGNENDPTSFIGSKTVYRHTRSFRKLAEDATLRFVITYVDLAGEWGGAGTTPSYACENAGDEGVCEPPLYASATFRSTVTGQANLLLDLESRATLFKTPAANLMATADSGFWTFAVEKVRTTAAWHEDDFVVDVEGFEASVHLAAPVVVDVDLSEVDVGETIWLEVLIEAKTYDQLQGETYVSSFIRDPQDLDNEDQGGPEIVFTGLEPIDGPPLPPDVERVAEECTTAIDPEAGSLRFAASTATVLEIPVQRVPITVLRMGGTRGDVSVSVSTQDGTAHAGTDYQSTNAVVFFPDGDDTPRVVDVPLVLDGDPETDEQFTVRMTDPRGCVAVGSPSTATVTILDDDQARDDLYSVGGSVTGLVGSGLVLAGPGSPDLIITSSGPFTFPQRWPAGVPYDVRVVTQPTAPAQTCVVANGSGVLTDHDVTDVVVTCAEPQPGNALLDPDFGDAGVVTGGPAGPAVDVALQLDGKILVLSERALTRYLPDGTFDVSFGNGGTLEVSFLGNAWDRATAMALQPDGKIVVVGEARVSQTDERGLDWAVARYLTPGAPDGLFGPNGNGVILGDGGSTRDLTIEDGAADVVLQPDGKIVVIGTTLVEHQPGLLGGDFLVARYHPSGDIDTSFGGGAVHANIAGSADIAAAGAIDTVGNVVVVGRVADGGGDDPDVGVVRYTPSGVLDPDFGNGGILQVETDEWDEARAVLATDDGGFVVAGQVNLGLVGGTAPLVVAYDADGAQDATFGVAGAVPPESLPDLGIVTSMARAVTGAIVLTAWAEGVGGFNDFGVARLTADGLPDTAFGDEGVVKVDFFGSVDTAQAASQQADGKVVVVGAAKSGTSYVMGMIRTLP